MDKQVHTSGVMVLFARAKMWCVRIGDNLQASNAIENLIQHLSDPTAKLGVWLEAKYIDVEEINNYAWRTLNGFIDLDSGEFFKSTQKSNVGEYTGDNNISSEEQAVIGKITEHMLVKWQKKFTRNQKI